MLFSPRQPPSLTDRLRLALWPRRSFGRSLRYVGHRILRLGDDAHGLAVGVSIGVFVASLPIPLGQMAAAALLAWLLRANVMAALLGTFWANPVTMPVLWMSAYSVGHALLGSTAPLWAKLMLGALPMAIALAGVFYAATRHLVESRRSGGFPIEGTLKQRVSRPVSRVLSRFSLATSPWTAIPLGRPLRDASSNQPGRRA